jgi:transcriptional regulator GlxA family with amidase domain
MAYLRRLRLHQAQRLLVEGDLAIGEIAPACGFADPFHFSRVCRRLTGKSPRGLRQHSA